MALFRRVARVSTARSPGAQVDGASALTIYRRIIIPTLRVGLLSVTLILAHIAIKSSIW